jgi:hypothetical protein
MCGGLTLGDVQHAGGGEGDSGCPHGVCRAEQRGAAPQHDDARVSRGGEASGRERARACAVATTHANRYVPQLRALHTDERPALTS